MSGHTCEHTQLLVRDFANQPEALEGRCLFCQRDELLAALEGLYADQVDYLTINKLGGIDNHWMVRAREAIAKAHGAKSGGAGE